MTMNRSRQPGPEPVGLAAFPQPLPDPENGILADILRRVNIAHHRMGYGQARPGMPGEKHAKCIIIAGAGAGEKRGVGAWIGLRRR